MRTHGIVSIAMAADELPSWHPFQRPWRRQLARNLPHAYQRENPYGNTPDLWYSYSASEGKQVTPVSLTGCRPLQAPRDFIRSSSSPTSDLNPAIDGARGK